MGTVPAGNGQRSEATVADLVKQLSEQTSRLARQEVELAKAELTEKGKRAGVGVGMFGGAGMFGFYCVGALVRMDGHSYTSKSWLDCGADPHYTHMKGWFQRTASYIDFKACLFKKMGNVYHYGYCTSQWK